MKLSSADFNASTLQSKRFSKVIASQRHPLLFSNLYNPSITILHPSLIVWQTSQLVKDKHHYVSEDIVPSEPAVTVLIIHHVFCFLLLLSPRNISSFILFPSLCCSVFRLSQFSPFLFTITIYSAAVAFGSTVAVFDAGDLLAPGIATGAPLQSETAKHKETRFCAIISRQVSPN